MTTPANNAMSAELDAQLAGLRDIRIPDAVSWWPLAPGWWILFTVLGMVIVGCLLYSVLGRRSIKRMALKELDRLRDSAANGMDALDVATEASVLIRRVVLRKPEGIRYANMHGAAWAHFLEKEPGGIPRTVAEFIVAAPYQSRAMSEQQEKEVVLGAIEGRENPTTSALIEATDTWIRRCA